MTTYIMERQEKHYNNYFYYNETLSAYLVPYLLE